VAVGIDSPHVNMIVDPILPRVVSPVMSGFFRILTTAVNSGSLGRSFLFDGVLGELSVQFLRTGCQDFSDRVLGLTC
jgi:hypothetical protein